MGALHGRAYKPSAQPFHAGVRHFELGSTAINGADLCDAVLLLPQGVDRATAAQPGQEGRADRRPDGPRHRDGRHRGPRAESAARAVVEADQRALRAAQV